MIFFVSSETVMTWPMRRRMYLGSSSRLASLTMPERGSVETRYWSMTGRCPTLGWELKMLSAP